MSELIDAVVVAAARALQEPGLETVILEAREHPTG